MSRPSQEPEVVAEVYGQAQAERLRAMLQAHGIEVWLLGESAGAAIGLSVGAMARIQLLVRRSDLERAREILGPDVGPEA